MKSQKRVIKNLSRDEWNNIKRLWLREKPCGGSADITPWHAIAQSKKRFTIDFIVGQEGISLGGGIAVYIPVFFSGVTQKKGWRGFYSSVLGEGETGSGYLVTAKTNRPDIEVVINISDWSAPLTLIRLFITKGYLVKGDRISVVIGDPADLPVNVQEFAQKVNFLIGVDFDATGKYRRIKKFPFIQVRGGVPDKLQITAKAIQKVGVPFEIVVAAVDKCNCNPSWQYNGKVKFFSTDPKAILPEPYQFDDKDDKDKGVHRFADVVFNTPGTHTVTALDIENSIIGKSHPISTDFIADNNKIYFGELHVHTIFSSDGTGTPDECYGLAKGADNFDFTAISDHAEDSPSNIDKNEKLKLTQNACCRYYEPGKFVTLLGFEWSYCYGNKNVYYRDETGDFFAPDSPDSDTPDKLFSILKDKDVIIIPHHPKYITLTDWSFHSEFQRLVEIYSIAGCSEIGGAHSVQSALAQGHKLGFIAGSDNHTAQAGHDESPYRKAGITAVITKGLTRESVFDALRNRHCYATTGKRILLDFRLNEYMMGKEITFSKSQMTKKRIIKVKVRGTAKIKKIDVVRNNVDSYTYHGKCENEEFEYIDKERITEILYSPFKNTLFYYIRVTQLDEELAWSSPIWINIS